MTSSGIDQKNPGYSNNCHRPEPDIHKQLSRKYDLGPPIQFHIKVQKYTPMSVVFIYQVAVGWAIALNEFISASTVAQSFIALDASH